MSDRAIVRTVQTATVAGVVLAVAGSTALIALGHVRFWAEEYLPAFGLIAVGLGAFAWLLVPRLPRNAIVWTMGVAASTAGLFVAAYGTLPILSDRPPAELVTTVPADLPPPVLWVQLLFAAPGWAIGLNSLLTFGLLLFPDGRLPSLRWRIVGWAAAASMTVLLVTYGIASLPGNTTHPDDAGVVSATVGVHLMMVLLCLVALVGRFRRSQGMARQQFKWVAWGAAVFVASYAVVIFTDEASNVWLGRVTFVIGVAVLVASYGIAVGRYRLYDIDLVVSRTLAYGILAVFITGLYSLIAVGIGELVGGSNLWLAVLATAIVAVAFEPVRTQVQRWANRIVYGTRATPYEVLAEITGTLANADPAERLLQQVASRLSAAVGAKRSAVWLNEGKGFVTAATSPPGDPLVASDIDDITAAPSHVTLIEHDGETLGALAVEKGRGEPLTAPEQSLLADLAGSTALVLRRMRLDSELQATARQLERSRRRLVNIQHDERRRLEHDLRDRVQTLVVTLEREIGTARDLAEEEGTDKAADILHQLVGDAEMAIQQIGELAQGLFPPSLEAHGLGASLSSLAERCPLDVHLEGDPLDQHPVELESAVYFCVSEALTNAAKHARGPVSVRVTDASGELAFAVTDAGPGFDPRHATQGSGLRNLADRLDTLGGSLRITSEPGSGTTVSGRLPIAVMAA